MAFLQEFLPVFWDWRELAWFVGVTMALNAGVIGTLGTALVMVERYGLFQNAKIQTQSSTKARSDPDLWECVRHLCKLHALQFPGLMVFYAIIKWRGMPTEGPLPPWPEIMLQLPIFYVMEDALFYWIHRLLHTRLLYKRIHKFHHRFHKPIGLAAEYTHPLELLLANTIPLLLGPLLFKAHIKTLWLWLVIRLVEGVDGHSGYDFWFMPYRYFPFRPGAGVHDFHHSHNVGNYGSFFLFWDVICGTDQPYRDHIERRAEKQRKD